MDCKPDTLRKCGNIDVENLWSCTRKEAEGKIRLKFTEIIELIFT